MKTVDIAILHDLLDLNDGMLFWKKRVSTHVYAGDRAGVVLPSGYRQVKINGVCYREHRVIWAMVNGSWPENEIDHINRNRADNRIENLRAATRSQNGTNIPDKKGSSMYRGVSSKNNRWRATLSLDGKGFHIGTYDSEADAARAYDEAAIFYKGDFAVLNFGGTC